MPVGRENGSLWRTPLHVECYCAAAERTYTHNFFACNKLFISSCWLNFMRVTPIFCGISGAAFEDQKMNARPSVRQSHAQNLIFRYFFFLLITLICCSSSLLRTCLKLVCQNVKCCTIYRFIFDAIKNCLTSC